MDILFKFSIRFLSFPIKQLLMSSQISEKKKATAKLADRAPDKEVTEAMIFNTIQQRLVKQFETSFPDKLAPKTVVIIPSLTMDEEILSKISGITHYEERMLSLLLLLRMP